MVLVKQCTATGEEHGLINILTNSVEFNDFKHMKGDMKEKCRAEKEEDARKVKVRYINHRGRHERLTKHYCRWAGDRIETWHFIPGYEYEVPMGLVKEVNASKMPVRAGLMSVDGVDVKNDGSPLDKDRDATLLHELVPAKFF